MSAGKKLLDKYAETCLAKSDAEIGRNLKVTRAAVNNWRKGTAHPDADSIEKMAHAIGEPVGPWLAQIEAERARTPAARMVWLRLAATLGAALALAMTALPAAIETARTLPIVSNMVALLRRSYRHATGLFSTSKVSTVFPL